MGKIIDYINATLDFRTEYKNAFGREASTGKMYCPFHHNTDTPSAKIYGNSLKCFGACGRWYTVYDLLKMTDPDRIERIKSTEIIPDIKPKAMQTTSFKKRTDLDLTLPIHEIIKLIV